MSIPSLPSELARSIVEHVDVHDTPTLLALMHTSRVMHIEAERILHRLFRVSTAASNVIQYLQSYRKRLEDLPKLQDCITYFHLSDFGSTFMKEDEADTLFTEIESILRLAKGLKEVTIEGLAGHPRLHKMLKTLPVSIEALTFETQSSHPPDEYEQILGTISDEPQFTALKHIALYSKASGDCWTNHSTCPLDKCSDKSLEKVLHGIQSLGGDAYVIRRLFQHCHSVSSLHWYVTDVLPARKCCVAHACGELLPNTKLEHVASLRVSDPEDEEDIVITHRCGTA